MKVSILSMQRINNYGSFWQAYALKHILEGRGHEVSFLDLISINNDSTQKHHRFAKLGALKSLVRLGPKRFFEYRRFLRDANQKYSEARKKYLGITSEPNFDAPCDMAVIGSDEIFNCDLNGPFGRSLQRFGDIPNAKRKISFAASCGQTDFKQLTASDRAEIAHQLKTLNAISVRDEHTAEFISELTNTTPTMILDPTLIYSFGPELDRGLPAPFNGLKYLLIYSYPNRISDETMITTIRKYAKRNDLTTISILGIQDWADMNIVIDPAIALACFRGAAGIVTDTFHGTILSYLTNPHFAICPAKNNSNKLLHLIKILNLKEHVLTEPDELPNTLKRRHEQSRADTTIQHFRAAANNFLDSVGL